VTARATRIALAAGTAVLVVAAALVARSLADPGRPGQAADPGTVPRGISQSARAIPANTALVPASGAYLGAYVQPAGYTQQAQVQAVSSFERQIGRPLAIVHVYHPWGKPFPSPADRHFAALGKILLLTWGGDPDTEAIIAGRDDAMIAATAEAIKALGHPVMLEFRHEMDRPNLQWTIHGPADYITAWDHVRAIFAAVGATNVSWVWCPTGQGFQSGRAQQFYPGDREVDWLCADVYATSTAQPLSQAAAPFLRWASQHDRPVIIGEFGVAGNPSGWPAWLAAAGNLARADHQIKAMAYFDANGIDSSGHQYQHWLGNQPTALAAFAALLREPFFRPGGAQ
jgi:hypothetical protein